MAPISINGTTGISGVDGSAGTPALQGSDTNTGIAFGSDVIIGSTGGTERFRCDSSGRLLVGTSTALSGSVNANFNSGNALLQVVGNSSGTPRGATIAIGRSQAASAISANDFIGGLIFADNASAEFAHIFCYADAAAGAGDYPSRLVFSTTSDSSATPVERMRISNNGTVYFGPGAGSTLNSAAFIPDGSLSPYLSFDTNYGGGTKTNVEFRRNGTAAGSITSTSTTTAYNTSSDYRLKENITLVTDGITRLQQLKPSRFNFKVDPTNTVDGFIAHEVQEVVPEAITGEKDAVDDNGNPIYQGIDQSKLVPLLTAALQEAVAKIESLETRLAALEVTP